MYKDESSMLFDSYKTLYRNSSDEASSTINPRSILGMIIEKTKVCKLKGKLTKLSMTTYNHFSKIQK